MLYLIEGLLTWMQARKMPLMAYSPLGQGPPLQHPGLTEAALAWCLSRPGVLAIPKTEGAARANTGALRLALTADDHVTLDTAFPPPRRKRPLVMLLLRPALRHA
ncbi:MAG: hypothetical protein ACKO4X_16080 [Alphaproteobacteria bacterium]